MEAPGADSRDIHSKVLEYEKFVNDRLKEDLRKVHQLRDHLYSRIAEYLQLKRTVEILRTGNVTTKKQSLKTMVDLGCNFYCQAKIEDTSTIFVDVGFGIFVEFTLSEAEAFIENKVSQLTKEGEKLSKDSAKIKAHIKLVLEGLRELQSIEYPSKPSRLDIL